MVNKFFPESNTQAGAPKIEGRPGSGSLLSSPPLHISAYHYLFINKDKEITLSSWITDKNYEDEEKENVSWK